MYDKDSNMVVQQYLPEDPGEFTSGCIVLDGICKSVVTLRRDLRDGNTFRTYRDSQTVIYDDHITKIAEALSPIGPVNFQFRVYQGKPVVFEINCRFSGTTPIRSFYGFNEVEAILNYYKYGKEINPQSLKYGVVLRTMSDIFISHENYNLIKDSDELSSPQCTSYNFK